MAKKKKIEEVEIDGTNQEPDSQPAFNPGWDQATCTANGYFFCSIQQACLNKPASGAGGGCSGGGSRVQSSSYSTMFVSQRNRHAGTI